MGVEPKTSLNKCPDSIWKKDKQIDPSNIKYPERIPNIIRYKFYDILNESGIVVDYQELENENDIVLFV